MQSIISKGLGELNAVSREAKRNECILIQKEWDQLLELAEVLGPFKVYTDILQGDQVGNGFGPMVIFKNYLD